jgi:hypothetical protein
MIRRRRGETFMASVAVTTQAKQANITTTRSLTNRRRREFGLEVTGKSPDKQE